MLSLYKRFGVVFDRMREGFVPIIFHDTASTVPRFIRTMIFGERLPRSSGRLGARAQRRGQNFGEAERLYWHYIYNRLAVYNYFGFDQWGIPIRSENREPLYLPGL